MVEYGATCTSPWSQIVIQHVHGAASRVGPTETAFAQRDESYVICMVAAWDGGEASQHLAWTRACWKALEPFARSGVYVNFLGQEGEGRVRAAYGVNYERLVALKNTYDPSNFFHLNQNIKPTVTGHITTHLRRHEESVRWSADESISSAFRLTLSSCRRRYVVMRPVTVGLMFWLRWKKLLGSYLFLRATSRS